MQYAIIDPLIEAWANAHSLQLYKSFAGREERYCYIWSPAGECFQIYIRPPDEAGIRIEAWSVETLDDVDLQEQWVVAATDLPGALERAFEVVRTWIER